MVFTHALICFRKTNERVQVRKYHTKALPMNKFVYFMDTEFFIYTVEIQATYLFIKHILCRLTITVRYNQQRKFILSY